ncbi:MAG: M56 family metallopeptidase [Planctomycetes bacterium]|nr:M56 family metallopeptidase [Planctomycetota bacterium]
MNALSEMEIVRACGWALLHSIWQGIVLMALLAASLPLLRRRSAALRYALAAAALALLLAAPVATAILLPLGDAARMPAPPAPVAVSPAGGPAPVMAVPAVPVEGAWTDVPAPAAPALPWRQRVVRAVQPILPTATAVWLGGVLVLSLVRFGGYARVRAIRRAAVPVDEPSLAAALEALARRLALSRPVRLLRSSHVTAPATLGWVRPVILLPMSALTGLDELQLRAILTHELAHIRRADYLLNLLQTVVESLLFYHPAAWWISARVRRERECCCDDVAAAVCGDRLRYAKALLALEEQRRAPVPLAVAADGGSLVGRVRRLLAAPEARPGAVPSWLGGAVVVVAALALAVIVPLAVGGERGTATVPVAEAGDEGSGLGAAVFPDDLAYRVVIIPESSDALVSWIRQRGSLSHTGRPGGGRDVNLWQLPGETIDDLLSRFGEQAIVITGRARLGQPVYVAATADEMVSTPDGPRAYRTGTVVTMTTGAALPTEPSTSERKVVPERQLVFGARHVHLAPSADGPIELMSDTSIPHTRSSGPLPPMPSVNWKHTSARIREGQAMVAFLPLKTLEVPPSEGTKHQPVWRTTDDRAAIIVQPIIDRAALAGIAERLPAGEGPSLGLLSPKPRPGLVPATRTGDRQVTRTYDIGDLVDVPPLMIVEPRGERPPLSSLRQLGLHTDVLEGLADTIGMHLPNPTDTDIAFAGDGRPWRITTSPANHDAVEAVLRSIRKYGSHSFTFTSRFMQVAPSGDETLRQWLGERGRFLINFETPTQAGTAWTLGDDAVGAFIEQAASLPGMEILVIPRNTTTNGQGSFVRMVRSEALAFGSGDDAPIGHFSYGRSLGLSPLLAPEGDRLSLHVDAELSGAPTHEAVPIADIAAAAVRVDLSAGQCTVVLRMPARRCALKLTGRPQPDGDLHWLRVRDDLAAEPLDPTAPPKGWVYVLVTTTNPQEDDGF